MADDFIKREDVVEILEQKQRDICPAGRYGRGYVYGRDRDEYDAIEADIDAISNIPAADVRHVVRGYWKPVRESEISGYDPALSGQDPVYMHRCSNCGMDSYLDENGEELLTAFCPMCGADMREDKPNAPPEK